MSGKNVYALWIIIFYFALSYNSWSLSLKVIPERANLTSCDPKYILNMTVNVRRYSRNSPYVLNIEGYNLQNWNRNVTIDIIFYEFLANEFRRSFVEMKFKYCDFINDPVFKTVFQGVGMSCPLPTGYHRFTNISWDNSPFVKNLPYVMPFEKAKTVTTIRTYPGRVIMAEGYAVLRFIQTKTSELKQKKN